MMLLAQAADPFSHEYHNATTLHPLGLTAVVILGVVTLCVSRPWAIAPMIILACFVSPAQRLVIVGIDFSLLRILVLFAWARLAFRQEYVGYQWRSLDYLIVAWGLAKTVAYTLLRGDSSALVFMLGQSYDLLGMYFFFRCVVRDWGDVVRVAGVFAIVAIPVSAAFLVEKTTGRNGFAIFGGVPEITAVRQGKLRATGAFAHPIIAGCFWAVILPLIAGLAWVQSTPRWIPVLGTACALVIIVSCASSTPLAGVAVAVVGACLFPLRPWLSWIRLGTLGMLVFLHFAMNKPVWHLISRVDIVGGSTGWHRYFLIDNAVNRFGEWAMLGTRSTAHWGHQMYDVTNQYVLEGVRGGFLTLVLFVAALAAAFRCVGRAVAGADNRTHLILAWAVGVSLFTHSVSFLAISYFGQANLVLFLSIALAGSVADIAGRQTAAQPIRTTAPPSPVRYGAIQHTA